MVYECCYQIYFMFESRRILREKKCIPWRRRQKDRKEDSQPARQIDRKLERNRGTDQEKKNNVKYKKYYKVRLGKSEDSS